MRMTALEAILDRRWWYGGPRDVWIRHVGLVEKLVNEQKLKPIDASDYISEVPMHATSLTEEAGAKVLPRIPFPGGIRVAHVHFKGDMYMLTDKQWSEFSRKLVQEFQSRLSKAHVLSFDSLMELSAAIDTVPLPE